MSLNTDCQALNRLGNDGDGMSEVKLHLGDCLEFMRTIPDKSIDLVLTDPPYGIGYDKTQNKISKSGRVSNGGKWKAYNDSWDSMLIGDEYIKEIFRISHNQVI